jgi:protein TonB
MKKLIIFIAMSIAFVFTSTKLFAQDTRGASAEYMQLDAFPTFKGGSLQSFVSWVSRRVEYPLAAMNEGISGTVRVRFVIDVDGRVNEAYVVDGVHYLLDAEVIRVVKKSPKWTPGIKDGKPVRVSYVLPIVFKMR